MIYVALLRGINVGGHNKVEMKELKTSFESLGFTDVTTYINSGNVVFQAPSKEQDTIVYEIEEAMKRDFQLEIKVLVRDWENMKTICQDLPATWLKNEAMRTEVMFLWENFDNLAVLETLPISSVDNVKYTSGAILWNVKSKDYRKSGMIKLVGTKPYKNMTVRNVNTVRKLYEIMINIASKK